MAGKTLRLKLSRAQILSFRRRAGGLEERLPPGAASLRRAAWAGLQDSMPRAALLSIHARVAGADAGSWEHPSLVQLWGPRFNDYVVAAEDLAVFSLGRLPEAGRRHERAHETAARLHEKLKGRRMPYGDNSLRYAALTGTVLLRWDGARQPVIWTVPAPGMEPREARLELARRYLHIFGPGTPSQFAKWAGIGLAEGAAAFKSITSELTPVSEHAWILAQDEQSFRSPSGTAAPARLLPSGDAYYLLWGAERELLVPDAKRRAELWTTRVWPGAVLVAGEIAGVWRRSGAKVSMDMWRRLSAAEWAAVESEALSLPLPGGITVQPNRV